MERSDLDRAELRQAKAEIERDDYKRAMETWIEAHRQMQAERDLARKQLRDALTEILRLNRTPECPIGEDE